MMRQEHEQVLKMSLGADEVRHSGRTLFEHLRGTYDLLKSWDAPEDVCVAGLFHSVYGTRTFKHQCLEPTTRNRFLVAELIGERAERLAYIFGVADRRAFSGPEPEGHPFEVRGLRDGEWIIITPQELRDLRLIEQANLQEQSSARPVFSQ